MYFILGITINEEGKHTKYEIIDHVNGNKPTLALAKLEETAMNYIKEEGGNAMLKDAKIIDVKSFDQICEPSVDKILIYRLDVDPYFLHLYERKTTSSKAYFYGENITTTFRNVKIFAIKEYEKLSNVALSESKNFTPEFATVDVENERIRVPKAMTIAPMCDMLKPMTDMINELKTCEFFENRKELVKAYDSDPENYVQNQEKILSSYKEKRKLRVEELRKKKEELKKYVDEKLCSGSESSENSE